MYIRPLLGVSKQEIIAYLGERGIAYVTDHSNKSDAYLRNRIRHTLLPAFKAVDARALTQLQETMQQLQNIEAYLMQHTHDLWQQMAIQENDVWCIDIKRLLEIPISMRHRLYVHWLIKADVPFVPTQRFFAEIEKFLRTKKRKAQHRLHDTWLLCKQQHWAFISKIS